MKVFDILSEAGETVQFEVSNLSLGRSAACRVVQGIPGVRMIRAHRPFAWGRAPADFCEFELNGVRFMIEEPFGDNSRYLVTPVPACSGPELNAVRSAFASAKVTGLSRFFAV
jgi:hypothetical protein